MAVDEQRLRQSLHNHLADLVGTDEAALLMKYLPPVGWADVATKRDLDVLRAEMGVLRSDLRGELAEIRGELRSELAGVRGEIAEIRGELRSEIAGVRGEIAGVRGEIKAQTTRILLWLVPTMIAGLGVAARLG